MGGTIRPISAGKSRQRQCRFGMHHAAVVSSTGALLLTSHLPNNQRGDRICLTLVDFACRRRRPTANDTYPVTGALCDCYLPLTILARLVDPSYAIPSSVGTASCSPSTPRRDHYRYAGRPERLPENNWQRIVMRCCCRMSGHCPIGRINGGFDSIGILLFGHLPSCANCDHENTSTLL